jgi:hypothetical protein
MVFWWRRKKKSPSAERTPATGSFGYLMIRRCGYPQHDREPSIVGGLISRAEFRPKEKNSTKNAKDAKKDMGRVFGNAGFLCGRGNGKALTDPFTQRRCVVLLIGAQVVAEHFSFAPHSHEFSTL